eukprot:Clim_evm23s153 gene=Clim_evmTU23s153
MSASAAGNALKKFSSEVAQRIIVACEPRLVNGRIVPSELSARQQWLLKNKCHGLGYEWPIPEKEKQTPFRIYGRGRLAERKRPEKEAKTAAMMEQMPKIIKDHRAARRDERRVAREAVKLKKENKEDIQKMKRAEAMAKLQAGKKL